MNIFLEKNPDSVVGKLVDRLKVLIDKSIYEDNVFIVGGAVRDFLLGIDNEKHDIDIAVSIESGGTGFATWLAYNTGNLIANKNPCIFETYGTAKVKLLNSPEFCDLDLECVQTRKEKYVKGSRNPSTAFGTIEQDAMRRDLTINALYYNISDDKIYDFTKMGFNDIKNKMLRCTGDANMVFDDDPLRIMRVCRMASRLEWPIEKNTWVGMVLNASKVCTLTQERVTDELNKILMTKHPSVGLRKLDACGVLDKVLPSLSMSKHVFQDLKPSRTLFEHVLEALDKSERDLDTRLAILFHDIGKLKTYDKQFMYHSQIGADMAEKVLTSMKYSNQVVKTIKLAIEHHEYFSSYKGKTIPRPAVIRKFISFFDGDEHALNVALNLIHANNVSQMFGKNIKFIAGIKAKIAEMDKAEESCKKIVLPVNGKDIMAKFKLKSGKIIGEIMEDIKKAYIESPNMSKEEAFIVAEMRLKKVAK